MGLTFSKTPRPRPSTLSPAPPPPTAKDAGFVAALAEARKSAEEGGIPIGACLVSADGRVIGKGHNMRVQKGSAVLHVSLCLLDFGF